MILAQCFAQDTKQWPQSGAGRHQPQRPGVPVRVIMQGTAAQFTETDRIADAHLPGGIAEFPGRAAIEMKLQKTVFLRQAGEGIRPRHAARPQHQVLPGAITQRSLGDYPQAQHRGSQPIDRRDFGRMTIGLRVEGVHLQVLDHLALARQPPALFTLLCTQGIGAAVVRQAPHTLHQARMATAGAATVRHWHAVLIQCIEQIAARRHRPMALADPQLRHRRSPTLPRIGCGRHAWRDRAPDRPAATHHRGRHPIPAGSCRRTG
ncbi:hypothetical protein D3C71_1104590 [compost metagenome]